MTQAGVEGFMMIELGGTDALASEDLRRRTNLVYVGATMGRTVTNRMGRVKLAFGYSGATAIQPARPNFCRKLSASCWAAAGELAIANVVDPLPDMSAPSAPRSLRNCW
jgi:hypothetical protein